MKHGHSVGDSIMEDIGEPKTETETQCLSKLSNLLQCAVDSINLFLLSQL